jgi:hypothetical protein
MPRIKMKVTTQGSSDGFTIERYERDKEYDVSPRLAQNFCVQQGIATPVPRKRAVASAPENKMIPVAPDNKEAKEASATTRVFQLADELGVSSKDVIESAKKCGIVVATPVSGLSDEEVEKIKTSMGNRDVT